MYKLYGVESRILKNEVKNNQIVNVTAVGWENIDVSWHQISSYMNRGHIQSVLEIISLMFLYEAQVFKAGIGLVRWCSIIIYVHKSFSLDRKILPKCQFWIHLPMNETMILSRVLSLLKSAVINQISYRINDCSLDMDHLESIHFIQYFWTYFLCIEMFRNNNTISL